jgi:ribosomal protein L37AE/L43A
MSYERKMAPGQPAANDPKYVVTELRARIAEFEAENERLKCCGNCGRNSDIGSVSGLVWKCSTDETQTGRPSHPYDPCHFTPSRWTERGKP